MLDPMRKTFLHLMTMIYECDQGPRARLAILCILYFKTFSVLLYLYDCPFQFIIVWSVSVARFEISKLNQFP